MCQISLTQLFLCLKEAIKSHGQLLNVGALTACVLCQDCSAAWKVSLMSEWELTRMKSCSLCMAWWEKELDDISSPLQGKS